MFGIKYLEETLLIAIRTWSRPVHRPISTTLCHSRPRYEICHNLNSLFSPTRFHHTASYASKSQLLKNVPSVAGITSRHYSSAQSSQQQEEPDTLYKWIELRCKGHDDAVLESYKTFVSQAADELGITVDSVVKPKWNVQKLTLLKSRHIFKKHRVQYEMRTHFRVIMLKHLTGSTADVFLEYVERNLPEGVAMQVKKCHLEKLPELLTQPTDDAIMTDAVSATQVTDKANLQKELSEDPTTSSSSDSSDSSDDERQNKSS